MAKKNDVWADVGRYSGLALLLPIATFVGYAIGYFIDKLFRTHFFYLVFLLLGIGAGFISLLRELLADTKQDGR